MKAIHALLALSLLALFGCGGSGGGHAIDPLSPGSPLDPESAETDPLAQSAPIPTSNTSLDALPTLADGVSEQSALGIYWLVPNPADPAAARLEPDRSATATSQGLVSLLSVRPYLTANSLTLLDATPGPNNSTDYRLRFTHPFPMPPSLIPPATATKRADLFIFDVNLVVTVPGTETYFGGQVKANTGALLDADGYRQLGPMVNLNALGVTNGTNVFPYRLITQYNPADPDGNYDSGTGWTGSEFLIAKGYDVIPQGASVETTVRVSNTVTQPTPVVVVAKYMDPRAGVNSNEKRKNRLPGADPTKMRYFLPEACGDLQRIQGTVQGELSDDSSTQIAVASTTVLDWDNSADVANNFPNHGQITDIAEESKPAQAEASFPQLLANGTFTGTIAPNPSGAIKELVSVSFPIRNMDQSIVAEPGGTVVKGLVRIRDTQDANQPTPVLLDEALNPRNPPAGYEPSTRYQTLAVRVSQGNRAPSLTGVTPGGGVAGTSVQFTATNIGGSPTTWSWNFGGGATPNTSTVASPTVTMGAVGTYAGSVTASNNKGTSTRSFTVTVTPPAPNVTAVSPLSGAAATSKTFAATVSGGTPTSWSWNFGGGATPNTSTASGPTVTLGATGSYNASVTATNATGADTFNFTLTVTAGAPNITGVTGNAGVTGTSKQLFATNTGGTPTSWSWNFGGGATPNTSTVASPTVTLGAIGSYSASVTATNGAGQSTYNFTLTVNSNAPALIGVSPLSGTAGTSRTFTATNTGGTPTSWSWNFGGGTTPNTSTAASPVVALGAVGSYSASVTATNGSGTDTFNFTLTVNPAAPNITGVSPTSGTTGTARTFSLTNTGGSPTSWSWNFGGGATPNTSTASSPSVTLGAAGNYNASVSATNAGGTSTFNFTLAVNPVAPDVTGVSPTSAPTGTSRTFSATVGGGAAASWSWNFGGGATPNTSTAASPTVTVGAVGSYSASVTATNAGGSDTFNFTLSVTAAAPDVTAVSPTSGTTAASRSFAATVAGGTPTSWSWNFGAGATPSTSTSSSPTVTLGPAGSYNASVTASNGTGSDTFNFTLVVNPAAPNLTGVTPTSGSTATSRTFSATNTGGTPTSWSWNFGGGATPNTSTSASPTVALGLPGTYSASVTASNAGGPSTFNFSLVVSGAAGVPVISSVAPTSTAYALRPNTFGAVASNTPTSWSWNFGGGATPNTSTSASPSVTLGNPGTYTGSVTATNGVGASVPFSFQYTVVTKKMGLRFGVITSGGVYPKKLYGMTNWDLPGVQAWVNTKLNPVFRNAGVEIDLNQITLVPTENPALFNIDSSTEENELWNLVLNQSATKLNTYAVNSCPMQPGLGGVMTDTSCNQNNLGRGCWLIPFGSQWDNVVMAHELGHVMNLPHIRTNTNPLTSANTNLMSYGTLSTALLSNATREDNASCIVWSGNPMNQFQVVNDWAWLNF
ncbi:MAG TPA: PKD domain-containing protein [bacterium]|nr:PKD domain-containing protein [bacterium]